MTGQELREIRESYNLTQAEFATLLGYAPNYIYRLERGENLSEPIKITQRFEKIVRITFPRQKVKKSTKTP